MQVIEDVKAGKSGEAVRKGFEEVMANITSEGAEIIVIACTELSVIAKTTFLLPVIDALEALAEHTVAVVKHGQDPFGKR